jgi:uncharacterized protein (TIGR02118 family)
MQRKMVSYFVRYSGQADDPGKFNAHYENIHARILRKFSNIQSLVLHRPAPWTDPFAINRGDTALLVQMIFNSTQDLDAALCSDARRQAREDFQNFPAFKGSVSHEAMSGKLIF